MFSFEFILVNCIFLKNYLFHLIFQISFHRIEIEPTLSNVQCSYTFHLHGICSYFNFIISCEFLLFLFCLN